MRGKLQIVIFILLTTLFIVTAPKAYAECVPRECNDPGNINAYCDPGYHCQAYCCVRDYPPPPGSSPTPGGSYEYQSCPVGQALSCGTVAEAGSQNKQRPADGFAKRMSG